MKLYFFALSLLTISSLSVNAFSQRDYLTPEEVELIRDAQAIDSRINVLTHAIDRRFTAMNVDVQAPLYKEKGDWGTAPAGSKLELLLDIKRILQKAVDDIDNLSERPGAMVEDPDVKEKEKQKHSFEALFPKAVRALASAAQRYQPVLKTELDKAQLPAEKGAILDSLDMCQEIIAAVAKLPAATADPKKTKN